MDMPDMIEATGEDAIHGLLVFANGRVGHWVQHHAGHGEGLSSRLIYGSSGSITAPGDRSGKPVRLVLDDGAVLTGEDVLDLAPSYRLEPMAAALFGGDRVASYEFAFAETDRKLLALEQFELARCVRERTRPEVDGRQGLHALAVVYSLFESQAAGRAVSLNEIESGELAQYQAEIDSYYGL
jgi:predicted dehydrogenase